MERDEDEEDLEDNLEELQNNPDFDENEYRTIKYNLGPDFFELSSIGTQLTFKVGEQPVKNLKMIERHYFKEQLI